MSVQPDANGWLGKRRRLDGGSANGQHNSSQEPQKEGQPQFAKPSEIDGEEELWTERATSSTAPVPRRPFSSATAQPGVQDRIPRLESMFDRRPRLQALLDMGFSSPMALRALEAARWNVDAAIEFCLAEEEAGANKAQEPRAPPVLERPRSGQVRPAAKAVAAGKASARGAAAGPLRRSNRLAAKKRSADDFEPSEAEESKADSSPVSGVEDDEDIDSDASMQVRRSKKAPFRALQEVSSEAQAVLLDALSGPEGGTQADFRRKRVEVRQAMGRGCLNLRTDHWGMDEDLVTRSPAFGKLKGHQRVGVRWLQALHKTVPGMILADEMGLGKTVQALCFLELLASDKPSLVIAPASLLDTWEAEAQKWTPSLRTFRYHSSKGTREQLLQDYSNADGFDLVITTAQAVHNKLDRAVFFRKVHFEYLICDEAHNGLKNAQTIRIKELGRFVKSERRLLLTGTPVQNSLTELSTLLCFALSSSSSTNRVGIAEELNFLKELPEEQQLRRLQAAAAPLILRRLKVDVLSELPTKRGVVVYCNMEGQQQKVYDEVLAHCRNHRSGKGSWVSEAFFRLRRVALHPLLGKSKFSAKQMDKMADELTAIRPDFKKAPRANVMKQVESWSDFEKHQAALEYGLSKEFRSTKEELLNSAKITELQRILKSQAEQGGKTLVFSQFTQMLDVVQVALSAVGVKLCRLDGSTAIKDRQAIVTSFQEEGKGPEVFLISTKAGGVGLNLTAANAVVLLDLDFNPQNSRQAEDRAHRLGQSKDVTVYYLVCKGTVDEMVLVRNIPKMRLDQEFGGKRGTLQVAVEKAGGLEGLSAESAAAAEAQAKSCEKQVMDELKELLMAKPHGKASNPVDPDGEDSATSTECLVVRAGKAPSAEHKQIE